MRPIKTLAWGEERRDKRRIIAAPIGTPSEVGAGVLKMHVRCSLSSIDEYATNGDGFLRISKDRTKESYEEEILPTGAPTPFSPSDRWIGGQRPGDISASAAIDA